MRKKTSNTFPESDYNTGLELIKQSDCFTCHNLTENNVGPAFREIANRYEKVSDSVVQMLSEKILKGGSGSWGTIPMVPHTRHTKPERDAMIKYILLTKYK